MVKTTLDLDIPEPCYLSESARRTRRGDRIYVPAVGTVDVIGIEWQRCGCPRAIARQPGSTARYPDLYVIPATCVDNAVHDLHPRGGNWQRDEQVDFDAARRDALADATDIEEIPA